MNLDHETLQKQTEELYTLSVRYKEACIACANQRALYEQLEHSRKTVYAMSFEQLADEVNPETNKRLSISAREIMANSTDEYRGLLVELKDARLGYYVSWAKEKAIKTRIDVVSIAISAFQSLMKLE